MKLYELYEVIQELRKDEKIVFKIVVVKDGKIIEPEPCEEFRDDHYLSVIRMWVSPYINGLRFHKGEFKERYAGIQFDDKCKWIKTNDLDDYFKK